MYSLHAPDWFQAIRLLVTFIVTAGLGTHAFYRFKTQRETGSPKLWAFYLYSVAFLMSSVLNFVSLIVTINTRTYGPIPGLSLGPFTIMLFVTYAAFALTVRPSRPL